MHYSGPKLVANAGALKPYSQLSPTQKLATTPLYFVSNSRGNAYLQEDVQVGELCMWHNYYLLLLYMHDDVYV